MPSLTQLEYIVTVAKLGHFGKAAKACHVSQPSLSAQIQKVEDEVGFLLFDRNKKPTISTEKGLPFIEQAKVIVREHHRLIEMSKSSEKEVIGTFRLGIIPTVAPYLLHWFIEDFSKKFPKVKLNIEELQTEEIIKQLSEDILDGGILATPLHEEGIQELPLYYEDFLVYLHENHPLSKKKMIHEKDLNPNELWLLEDGHCLRTQVLKICASRKEKPAYGNVFFQSGNLETLRNIARSNGGYTVLPASYVELLGTKEKNTNVRPFTAPVPSREISLVYRRDQWKKDILKAIEECVTESIPDFLAKTKNRAKQKIMAIE